MRHNSVIENPRKSGGFTLIELMMVIVIVGILMGVALPAYNKQLVRGKRIAAQAEMLDIANRQQQYLLTNRAYFDKTILLASGFVLDPDVSANYTYTVTVGAGAAPTYLITFTPYGGQASDVELTLDEQGVGEPADKWDR
ncbi:MAG: type IV pilin protein [Halioglobus sp.]